ncbi:hypothetical protein D3C72_844500 [compost metagenome]
MKQLVSYGLVISCLLGGCTMPAPSLTAAPEFVPDIKTNTIPATVLPAMSPTPAKAQAPVWPKKTVPGAAAGGGATGGQAEGSAGAAVAGAHLKLADTEDASLKLIPMLDDNDKLQTVRTLPAAGTISWRVQAVGSGLAIAKARFVLRREANRPPEPPRFVEGQPTPSPASPEPEKGEPITHELAATAVEAPAAPRAGSTFTLKLGLKGPEATAFLAANPRASRASATVTLLDAAGQPLPGEDGTPLTLTATVSVL